MGDMILSMSIIYAMAVFYYGIRALALGALSGAAALSADALCVLLRGKKPRFNDFSALVTGMIIPLMLPASVPYSIVLIAVVFAVAVAKHPFGGLGYNTFNPAAAGLAFVTVCFPSTVFSYSPPRLMLPLFPPAGLATAPSSAFILHLGGIPNLNLLDMALGNVPGPMGATNILVALTCLLYLILRGTVRWQTPVAFFATFFGLCWLFPLSGMDRLNAALTDVMSGSILFGGVFLLNDPVTSPQRSGTMFLYGAAVALVSLLYRRYGRLEDAFVFVLLLMNASVWMFDIAGEKAASWFRRRVFETDGVQKIQKKP